MAVTQQDIARRAGVSQRTVSRCFIDPDAVAPPLLQRILRLARKAGYRPNQAARNMRHGRFETVSLLGDPAGDHAHPRLLAGIHGRLAADRYQLFVADLPAALDQAMTDGFLVRCHPDFPEHSERRIAGLGLPTIWINTLRDLDCVCPDDRRAGVQATRRLLELGHTRIAYLDCARAPAPAEGRYLDCRERLRGYREALRTAKLPERILQPPPRAGLADLFVFYRRIFSGKNRPTAVLACRMEDAQTLLYAVGLGAGVRPSLAVSVIAFADAPAKTVPSPASYTVPWADMGSVAADMLMKKIRGAGVLSPEFVPMIWHEGDTLCPPPSR